MRSCFTSSRNESSAIFGSYRFSFAMRAFRSSITTIVRVWFTRAISRPPKLTVAEKNYLSILDGRDGCAECHCGRPMVRHRDGPGTTCDPTLSSSSGSMDFSNSRQACSTSQRMLGVAYTRRSGPMKLMTRPSSIVISRAIDFPTSTTLYLTFENSEFGSDKKATST
jgi:hypothetical protein